MTQDKPSLSYSEAGQGEAVLLLDWTPWESSSLACALADRYRLISIDPPFMGQTPEGQSPCLELELGRAVGQVVGTLGLQSCSVVGTSLGADAALAHALLQGERVGSLVLISPTVVEPVPSILWNTPELAAKVLLAHPDSPTQGAPSEAKTAGLWEMAREQQSKGPFDSALLRDLDCATLVVYGQEDRLVSRRAGWAWKENAANCHVCYVYDAGHAVALDRPEALAGLVLDFLERRETFIVENRSSLINP